MTKVTRQVRVSQEVFDLVREHGAYGETFDDVLRRMLKAGGYATGRTATWTNPVKP